jgi:protein FrlC
MKFSFLTYQFARYPLEYCFRMAREYGFDGVEVWGARPHAYAWDMDEASVREVLGWKKCYGVEISMFTPEILAYPYSLTSASVKEREETAAYLIRSVETAAALGTDKMQITAKHPGYGRNRDEVWEILTEGVGTLCRRAETLGVDIILESLSPSEGNTITCADDIVKLQRMVRSPALCAMIDVVPPLIANEPYSEYFDKLGGTMKYVHICNSDGATEFHSQLDDPAGVLPLVDFMRILKRNLYDGWCSTELLAPYFRDPELYLSQSMRAIDRICGEAGISRCTFA